MKFYLFSFILESAVVRSEMEVVSRCEDVQVDANRCWFHNALCGHTPVVIIVSRFIVGYYFINYLN